MSGSGWLQSKYFSRSPESSTRRRSESGEIASNDGALQRVRAGISNAGSGLLKAVTGSPSRQEGRRITSTPKERLLRRQKVCSRCGVTGHVHSECAAVGEIQTLQEKGRAEAAKSSSGNDAEDNSTERTDPMDRVNSTEPVVIYSSARSRKSSGSLAGSPSSLNILSPNSMPGSPFLENFGSRTSPFSPTSYRNIPGLRETVPISMPSVELPEEMTDEEVEASAMHEASRSQFHEFVDAEASAMAAENSRTSLFPSSQSEKAPEHSDWSDFDKYGIDIDLFVGSSNSSGSASGPKDAQFWDKFTRGNYNSNAESLRKASSADPFLSDAYKSMLDVQRLSIKPETSERTPAYTSSGILEPRLWPDSSDSSQNKSSRARRRAESSTSTASSAKGWMSSLGLQGRSRSAPSSKLKALMGGSGPIVTQPEDDSKSRNSRSLVRSTIEDTSADTGTRKPPVHQRKKSVGDVLTGAIRK